MGRCGRPALSGALTGLQGRGFLSPQLSLHRRGSRCVSPNHRSTQASKTATPGSIPGSPAFTPTQQSSRVRGKSQVRRRRRFPGVGSMGPLGTLLACISFHSPFTRRPSWMGVARGIRRLVPVALRVLCDARRRLCRHRAKGRILAGELLRWPGPVKFPRRPSSPGKYGSRGSRCPG
jgi:hypothetical protein